MSVDPALINTATFYPRIFPLFDSVTIVNLDFVAPHQVNSRVGALRNAKFHMELYIAEIPHGYQINRRCLGIIYQHSLTGRDKEMLRMARVESHRCSHLPCAVGRTPGGKIFSVEKNLSVLSSHSCCIKDN